jgi:uncharacterized protein YkwD
MKPQAPALLMLAFFAGGARADAAAQVAREKPNASAPGVISPVDITAQEFATALLAETNRVRRANSRQPFKPLTELDAAADDQAALMALVLNAQHLSPIAGQQTPADRVRRRGLEPAEVAENVASLGFEPAEPTTAEKIAAQLVANWMNSPGHRANLLNRTYTHLGGAIRLVQLPNNLWCAYGVQVFFRPVPSSAHLPP